MYRIKHALVALLFCGLVAGNMDWIAPTTSQDCYAKGGSRSSRPSSRPAARPSSRPSSRPSTSSKSSPKSSAKPPSSKYDTKAASAAKKQQSKATYKPQAPKPSYTNKSGKTVKVDPKAKSTTSVRNLSSEQYRTRDTRVEHHYHNTYGDRYGYYQSQPYFYVGGGYSSIFYYSMLDWSIHRRAQWYYHNQSLVAQNATMQTQMQNAELQAEVAKLKAGGLAVNSNYIDSEYQGKEDLMYSDDFVNAAYNPSVTQPPVAKSSGAGKTILIVLACFVLGGVFIYFVWIKDWK